MPQCAELARAGISELHLIDHMSSREARLSGAVRHVCRRSRENDCPSEFLAANYPHVACILVQSNGGRGNPTTPPLYFECRPCTGYVLQRRSKLRALSICSAELVKSTLSRARRMWLWRRIARFTDMLLVVSRRRY